MKKIFLVSLLLLGISNAFGVSITNNDIAIEYKKGRFYTGKITYRTSLGLPYCITISNHSKEAIVVSPSLIKNPLSTLNEIAKAIRHDYKTGILIGILALPIAGYISFELIQEMRKSGVLKPPTIYPFSIGTINGEKPITQYFCVGSTIALSALTSYLLYKLTKDTQTVLEEKLAREVLHTPLTILPGESIQKLVWLKNPKEPIEIDFDSIKNLK